MLPQLFRDKKYLSTGISQCFFALIFQIYSIHLSHLVNTDKKVIELSKELEIRLPTVLDGLLKSERLSEKAPTFLETCKKFLRVVSDKLNEKSESLGDIFDMLGKEVNLTRLIQKSIQIVYDYQGMPIEYTDYSLIGLLKLIEILIIKSPSIIPTEERKQLLVFLLDECLYKMQEQDGKKILIDKALYKNTILRKTAMDLCLSMLNQKFQKEQSLFVDSTYGLLGSMKWRSLARKSWYCSYSATVAKNASRTSKQSFEFQMGRKVKSTAFVGLDNLTNTCYMNSILQQLFMIPCFRTMVLKVDNPKANDVLYQSKFLMSVLLKLDKQSFTPRNFFESLTDVNGVKFNPMEQRDADEFFARYLDLLEEGMHGTDEAKQIKNLFEGQFSNQLICIDCPHRSDRDESFVTLSLQVKNKRNITESLFNMVESEILQGDNAYNCTECDRKVNCIKRTCIKKLPNTLVTVLKRFELNYDTMTHCKFNGRFEFPKSLNMKEYTVEHIEKQSLLKEIEEKGLSIDDLDEQRRKILETSNPDDYYEYDLKGIVIHMGEANSGHYYSYINGRESENDSNWYHFNDTSVTPFDLEDIDDKAFGGETKINFTDEEGGKEFAMSDKTANAYMLFYERKQTYLWHNIDEDTEELFKIDNFGRIQDNSQHRYTEERKSEPIEDTKDIDELLEINQNKICSEKSEDEVQMPPEFAKIIQNINMKEWQLKYLFSSDIIDSISNFLINIDIVRFLQYDL